MPCSLATSPLQWWGIKVQWHFTKNHEGQLAIAAKVQSLHTPPGAYKQRGNGNVFENDFSLNLRKKQRNWQWKERLGINRNLKNKEPCGGKNIFYGHFRRIPELKYITSLCRGNRCAQNTNKHPSLFIKPTTTRFVIKIMAWVEHPGEIGLTALKPLFTIYQNSLLVSSQCKISNTVWIFFGTDFVNNLRLI